MFVPTLAKEIAESWFGSQHLLVNTNPSSTVLIRKIIQDYDLGALVDRSGEITTFEVFVKHLLIEYDRLVFRAHTRPHTLFYRTTHDPVTGKYIEGLPHVPVRGLGVHALEPSPKNAISFHDYVLNHKEYWNNNHDAGPMPSDEELMEDLQNLIRGGLVSIIVGEY